MPCICKPEKMDGSHAPKGHETVITDMPCWSLQEPQQLLLRWFIANLLPLLLLLACPSTAASPSAEADADAMNPASTSAGSYAGCDAAADKSAGSFP